MNLPYVNQTKLMAHLSPNNHIIVVKRQYGQTANEGVELYKKYNTITPGQCVISMDQYESICDGIIK